MYQSIHLWSVAAVTVVFLIAGYLAMRFRRNERKKRALPVGVSLFQLGFEVFWRLIYLLVKGDSALSWWPVYPCNLGGILIPLIAMLRIFWAKRVFYLFGFVGGCMIHLLNCEVVDRLLGFTGDYMFFNMLEAHEKHRRVTNIKRGCRISAASF